MRFSPEKLQLLTNFFKYLGYHCLKYRILENTFSFDYELALPYFEFDIAQSLVMDSAQNPEVSIERLIITPHQATSFYSCKDHPMI